MTITGSDVKTRLKVCVPYSTYSLREREGVGGGGGGGGMR
jgi:hypothetical protein